MATNEDDVENGENEFTPGETEPKYISSIPDMANVNVSSMHSAMPTMMPSDLVAPQLLQQEI